MKHFRWLQFAIALCILTTLASRSYGTPITMKFTGTILSSYSNSSWVGLPIAGSFTIYPDNFASQYSQFSTTSTQVYTFLGPAYGTYGNPAIDYSVTLPDGSVYNAPHVNEYAEWGGVAVHYNYLGGPDEETYQVGLQIQPMDRSYQANFFFILDNFAHDGSLVSSPDINQTPNLQGADYVNAELNVFNYRTFTNSLDATFSVNSLQRQQLPEPSSLILVVTAIGSLVLIRRRRVAIPDDCFTRKRAV